MVVSSESSFFPLNEKFVDTVTMRNNTEYFPSAEIRLYCGRIGKDTFGKETNS